ncbi:MAG: sulfite exporter TauE/SafE family protein [Bacteroidota bacterium]|nr:sulfite exporter TauE/SafE family protein [Bacteroidota bacterium]
MMNNLLNAFALHDWLLIALGAFIIGLSKAGLKGIEMLNVTLMAIVFGGKASTGIVLPLLCTADVLAVIYYRRHVQWPLFWKVVPWMMIGILAGVWLGKDLNEGLFRKVMAIIIIFTVGLMLLLEWRRNLDVPNNPVFTGGMGLVAGFTTMLGNLGGAFSNVYFLAMQVPKNEFIGTAAWVFLAMNFFKLPFQIFYWNNVSGATVLTGLLVLPALLAGFFVGLRLVSVIRDEGFRKLVIVLTLIGAVFIFLKR